MVDRWAQFNRRIDEEYNELKKKMTITIYGSYQPQSELDLLLRQKQCLIDSGYVGTRIVMDYDDEGLSPLEISKRCLQFSDVNFLIFTNGGRRHGVIRELSFIAEDRLMRNKVQFCTVFDQIVENQSSVPPLSADDINNSGIVRQEFTNEQSLQRAISAKSFWYLRKLRTELQSRPDT